MSKRARPERTAFRSFPAPLREALAQHEAFRKLGFTPDQIFMHRNPAPHSDIIVAVEHHGKMLAVTLGVLRDDDWLEQWKKLVELFNSHAISEKEFQAWYDQSFAGTHHVDLLLALQSKGIEPPLGKD